MPPSLYLQTLSGVLSLYRMARASYSRPLTLTLSPGRGNQRVDTDHALPVSRFAEVNLTGEPHICSLLPLREMGWG